MSKWILLHSGRHTTLTSGDRVTVEYLHAHGGDCTEVTFHRDSDDLQCLRVDGTPVFEGGAMGGAYRERYQLGFWVGPEKIRQLIELVTGHGLEQEHEEQNITRYRVK